MAPPSGLRFISAATTASVNLVTSSRTRDDAAPCPPWTARKAFAIAMVILAGSKPTTAPLRRITLYCAKRGSEALATGLPGSPTIKSRGGADVGVFWAVVAVCIGGSPIEIGSLRWGTTHLPRKCVFYDPPAGRRTGIAYQARRITLARQGDTFFVASASRAAHPKSTTSCVELHA